MILIMVALGGATRLTGSGLSIMEWAPLAGIFPPWSETEWQRLFGLYQQIPQYSLLHEDFGLADFKRIFWLEWVHRFWGRLIGAVFLIPLIWFAATGRLERRLVPRLVVFFLLGGLQGAAGWFMVKSGFFPDAIAVAPVRLVVHLALALILYGAVLWTALTLLPPGPSIATAGRLLKGLSWTTVGLVALTIVAGGFVAGLHAGLTYNTFPLMDGRLLPEGYSGDLAANIAAVQFNHRLLASLTLLASLGVVIAALPYHDRLRWRAAFVGGAVLLQYGLGVATLLLAVPVGLAVMHQVGATLLLTAALLVAHAVRFAPWRVDREQIRRAIHGVGHGQTAWRSPFHGSATPSAAPKSTAPGQPTRDSADP
jgi:cytochrome c oxidase assembly protein subunit 15